MIDEKRALNIARKAFGMNLISIPDDLYKLINEAVKDEQDRIVSHSKPLETEGDSHE